MTIEEKVLKAMEPICPSVKLIDSSNQRLFHIRQEMTMTLLQTFADEYHQFHEGSGTIVMDGVGFHQVVLAELRNRQLPTTAENNDAMTSSCALQ